MMMFKISILFIIPALALAGKDYLDIAGVLKCDGKLYKGATVLAVDKGTV